MACEDAVQRGFLADNPVRRTAAPPAADSGRAGWTVDEARRFLAATAAHLLGPAFHLALTTGLRRGELLGLRWSDIDLDSGRVRLAQQLAVEGGRARLKPLHPGDRRVVALASPLVEMLGEHRQRQEAERVLAGDAWRGGDLVFTTPTGGWVAPESFARVMDTLVEQSGVPRITPNSLRHTARALADAIQSRP